MTKLIIRADGSSSIGMGHFVRTLALAEMLKDKFECIFVTQSPNLYQINEIEKICHGHHYFSDNDNHFERFLEFLNGDEIVILDNYYYSTEYQKEIKKKGCKLVCIDDIHDKRYLADIVINHAPVSPLDFNTAIYTKLLIGFNYSLLRRNFLNHKIKKIGDNFSHVLVCFGGSDLNNLTNKTVRSLGLIKDISTVSIIIGNSFPYESELRKIVSEFSSTKKFRIEFNASSEDIIQMIHEADLGIAPCSTILYEMISQGLPVITGFYVENQIKIASNIRNKYPHILEIGDLNRTLITSEHIETLKNNVKNCGTQKLIYNSTEHLRIEFETLNHEFFIKIRKANINDVDLYYEWVNESNVRRNSINSDQISYQAHLKWFKNKIGSSESVLFVFEESNLPIGQVRFDYDNYTISIDYSVDKNYRGKRIGSIILKLAMENLNMEDFFGRSKFLVARVKKSNTPSIKIFQNLNFNLTDEESILGMDYMVFKKEIYEVSNC